MRCRARRSALFVALLAAGCSKSKEQPDPAALEIAEARAVRHGPVGIGESEVRATYALVDVRNTGGRAIVAEVAGELFDESGNSLGPTRPEILTIPAGATRMFALVDAKRRVVDNAARVDARITGASLAHAEPPLVVRNQRQYTDQGRAVVAGFVENRGDGEVTVMVIAAFYDASGAPMEREAVPYSIDGGQRRGTQHVGPPGSTRGELFVADFD
jgi:hypothetical protein